MLEIIYLHGFASSPASAKAQTFRERCAREGIPIRVPDLNDPDFRRLSVRRMVERTGELIEASGSPVALVGSSLGGYVAALAARQASAVGAMVLLAPAVDPRRRWMERMGGAAMDLWRRRGSVPVFHHGAGRELELGYGFFEELAALPPRPHLEPPTLVYHGRDDEVIPVALVEEWAGRRDNVELRILEDTHELRATAGEIVEGALAFLRPLPRATPSSRS